MKIENIIITGITEVFVHLSESGEIEVAAKASEVVQRGNDKIKVDAHFNDGSVMNFCVDIDKKTTNTVQLIKCNIK